MKKFELHWQILIALILAIIFGLMFPTSFRLTEQSYFKIQDENISQDEVYNLHNKLIGFTLKKEKIPQATIDSLKSIVDKAPTTRNKFLADLEVAIGHEKLSEYKAVILKYAQFNEYIPYVSWMGDIFMRALKMIIIPLILGSIISGVANMGSGDNLGRLGVKTMLYYIFTSTFAILTGLIFVNILQPGDGLHMVAETTESTGVGLGSLADTLINIIPKNIFVAFIENQMLSIIFFSILFGFFITKVTKKYQTLLTDFFNSIFEVMMKITMFILKFTPFGIFGIVAKVVSEQDDFGILVQRLGIYMFAVFAALAVHFFITLPIMVKFIAKSKPWKHLKAMTTPLLTAFSTSSSGAALPFTMDAIERKTGVSSKITSFTLPLGATINMDGTALYECVAVIFIAQAYDVPLSFLHQIIIVVTALLASIGAAAIPMAGLVMMSIILTAVGLPLEGVSLILAVDRILDMFRTATNVWSDSCGAVVIAKSEGETLNIDN